MKLYQSPGGTWAGTEKDWANALKAEGLNPKLYDGRRTVDVPTSKAELLEFLTFHSVNVINPSGPTMSSFAPNGYTATAAAPVPTTDALGLEQRFAAAPLRLQLELAVKAIDAADRKLFP